MAEHILRTACIDQVLPTNLREQSYEHAIRENSGNGTALEGAVLSGKLWKPGRTLHVRFLDGSTFLQEKVIFYAQQWTVYANLIFTFDNNSSAELRVSFSQLGNWSTIGTDALVVPSEQATMNFGEFNPATVDPHNIPETRYAAVILHEFGHALGMIHEHQLPDGGIEWNRKAVIYDLSGPPNHWSLGQIEANIFERYSSEVSQFSGGFDAHSIMLYAFPSHWTLNGLSYNQNSELSAVDKGFISQCYPTKLD